MNSELLAAQDIDVFSRMPPGVPVFFQFPQHKTSHKTIYVGCLRGECLVLHMPATPGLAQQIMDSGEIVVRFIHEGEAYGFESRFVGTVKKPAHFLFVEFPKNLHRLMLRECKRLTVLEEAVLLVAGQRFEGVLVDLSCGGCRVVLARTEARQVFGPGLQINTEFILPAQGIGKVVVQGTLLEAHLEETKVNCRIVFDKNQGPELEKVAAYVQRISTLMAE